MILNQHPFRFYVPQPFIIDVLTHILSLLTKWQGYKVTNTAKYYPENNNNSVSLLELVSCAGTGKESSPSHC